jgi:hypothetical protein
MNITQSVYVCVAFGTQHGMRMRHIVICGLPSSTIFFHITERYDFRGGGGGSSDPKIMCFEFLYSFCLEYLSF